MALTPSVRSSQNFVFSVTGGTTEQIDLSQAGVMAVANFPTEQVNNSQNFVLAVTGDATEDIRSSQNFVMVVARGRVDDPKVRVWTYTLDGHDYYVLRLGNEETLVYDTHSEEWFVWGSNTSNLWKAFQGINWIGSEALAETYGSNVIVGDDANGSIYFLNPEAYKDDDPVEGADSPNTFERVFQGQLQKRSYDYEKMFAVELLGSIGKMGESDLTDITLSISDDQGITYTEMGTVSITNEDYNKRVDWRSLGAFTAPGRLFKLVDDGALVRIDSLTADTDRQRDG